MQNGKVCTAANRRGSGYELGNAKDSFGATLTEWFALVGSKRKIYSLIRNELSIMADKDNLPFSQDLIHQDDRLVQRAFSFTHEIIRRRMFFERLLKRLYNCYCHFQTTALALPIGDGNRV